MKKRFLPLLIFIFLFNNISQAQEEEKEIEQSLKIYSSFQYLPARNIPLNFFEIPNFSYHSTSLGLLREKKSEGKFIEFSFSFSTRSSEGDIIKSTLDTSTISNPPIMYFESTSFAKSNDLRVGLRFDKGRWIERFSTEKLKIGFSTSIRAFAYLTDLKATESSFYNQKRQQYYLTIGFNPRIRYDFNSKFHLALNFPFDILGAGLDALKTENPALTESQQKQGSFSFAIGGEALIRLGVGYNL